MYCFYQLFFLNDGKILVFFVSVTIKIFSVVRPLSQEFSLDLECSHDKSS